MLKFIIPLLLVVYIHASIDLKVVDVIKPQKPPPAGTNCTKTLATAVGRATFSGTDSDHHCLWTIVPKNETANTTIFLFFDRMLLTEGDNVTVRNAKNETVYAFQQGQKDGVIVITAEQNVTVELNTSSSKDQRHFSVQYQSQECTFSVYDETLTVMEPKYAVNHKEEVACNFHYDLNSKPGLNYGFSFQQFNLSSGTSLQVTGTQEGIGTFTGSTLPPDVLGTKGQSIQFTIAMPLNSIDHFVLERWIFNAACTEFKKINGNENIVSPSPQALTDSLPTKCLWHIKNENPSEDLGLQFQSVNMVDSDDILTVVDGTHLHSSPFLQVSQANTDSIQERVIRSSTSQLIISFNPTSFNSNFSANIFNAGSGRYMKDNGTLKGSPSPVGANSTVFLLEVKDGQNVVLNFKDFSIAAPASLDIYADFTTGAKMIASLHSNVWYPIISPSSKMMIKAINFATGSFEATFSSTATGCMHMSPGVSDSYSLFGNCNGVCGWIIPPITSSEDLFLDLQYLQLEKDDQIQVFRLDAKKTLVADITDSTKQIPQFSLSAMEGAYVNITRGACPKKEDKIVLVARSNYLPACSQNYTVSSYDTLNLTSPNYPNFYPLHSDCIMRVTRASDDQLIYLTFNMLDLATDHCLNMTQITKNGTNSFSLFGNQMPEDMIITGDLILQFNAIGCNATKNAAASYNTARGFHIALRSTDCGGLIMNKTATLTTNPKKNMCIFKVTVPPNESDGSVNTIIYSDEADKAGNYELQVYDGPSLRYGLIANDSASGIWSRTNSLIFVYDRLNSSQPSSQVTIKYKVENCNKSMLCENKLCMHPDWRCNGKNDCGDFTDEKNCAALPIPKDVERGISSVTFGVCVVVFFVLGAFLALFVPKIIDKYRGYQRFQDISVIE